jgi:hypothetical protein
VPTSLDSAEKQTSSPNRCRQAKALLNASIDQHDTVSNTADAERTAQVLG